MVDIDSVKFGEIVVKGKTYFSDMIVWWDEKIEYRDKIHVFDMSEFLKLVERAPEIIVIGLGMQKSLKILPEVEQVAADKGIEIFSEISSKAAEIFNAFLADGKKAVAVIHST